MLILRKLMITAILIVHADDVRRYYMANPRPIKSTFVEAKSTPDIGFCEGIQDSQPVMIDCFSGDQNFCCNDKKEVLWNNVIKWSKRCCTEAEYVLQNA